MRAVTTATGTVHDLLTYGPIVTGAARPSRTRLTRLWAGGAGNWFGFQNAAFNFDGYDLTPELFKAKPGGLLLRDLLTLTWTIRRDTASAWLNRGDWQLDSVAVYVNDQLLGARYLNKMVGPGGTVTDSFRRGA